MLLNDCPAILIGRLYPSVPWQSGGRPRVRPVPQEAQLYLMAALR